MLPGLMYGEISSAPMCPPPGPVPPGCGEPGPAASPQQDEVSESAASSKVISRRPPCLNAAEPVIFGTQVCRNLSMSPPAEVPLCWLMHGKSWPSLQRFGVMNEKAGVVEAFFRSVASPVSPGSAEAGIAPVGEPSATTCAPQ